MERGFRTRGIHRTFRCPRARRVDRGFDGRVEGAFLTADPREVLQGRERARRSRREFRVEGARVDQPEARGESAPRTMRVVGTDSIPRALLAALPVPARRHDEAREKWSGRNKVERVSRARLDARSRTCDFALFLSVGTCPKRVAAIAKLVCARWKIGTDPENSSNEVCNKHSRP